jgi:signal recognition particle subunit SRP19
MVSKRQRMMVLWPEYFDSHRTVSQGRRVTAKMGVSNPKLDEISKVLKTLSIKHTTDVNAKYPATWHKPGGRILIPYVKDRKKTQVIKWVGRKLKVNRQS